MAGVARTMKKRRILEDHEITQYGDYAITGTWDKGRTEIKQYMPANGRDEPVGKVKKVWGNMYRDVEDMPPFEPKKALIDIVRKRIWGIR